MFLRIKALCSLLHRLCPATFLCHIVSAQAIFYCHIASPGDILLLHRFCSGDDFRKFGRNRGLPQTVVLKGQRAYHIAGVAVGIVH